MNALSRHEHCYVLCEVRFFEMMVSRESHTKCLEITTENTNGISKSIPNADHESRLQDDKQGVRSSVWGALAQLVLSMETLFHFCIHENVSLEMEDGHKLYTLAGVTESRDIFS
jgi:hypothetical protein